MAYGAGASLTPQHDPGSPAGFFFGYVKSLAADDKRTRIHIPMIQNVFSPAMKE
jgi:hypothetical protein